MTRRAGIWSVMGLLLAAGCEPALCPADHSELTRTREGTVERWCEDGAGLVDGAYLATLPDGRRIEGRFVAGQPDGLWRFLAADGTVEEEIEYAGGLPHGLHRRYENGALHFEHFFASAVPCGLWRDDIDGEERRRDYGACTATTGAPIEDLRAPRVDNGWDGRTCPAGRTAIADPVDDLARACVRDDDGVRDGPAARWIGPAPLAATGSLAGLPKRADGAFADGRRSGRWHTFHDDGALSSTGRYVDDVEDGVWSFYRRDGSLEQRVSFARGVRTGPYLEVSDRGIPTVEGAWVDGREDGPWAFRTDLGLPVLLVDFVDGVRAGPATEFHEGGAPSCSGAYRDDARNGVWECLFVSGVVESRGGYVGGRRDGLWEFFAPDGQPLQRLTYRLDEQHGPFALWSALSFFGGPLFVVRHEGTMEHDRIEGIVVGRYELPDREDEPVASEVNYEGGLRDGLETLSYPDGTVASTITFVAGRGHGRAQAFNDEGITILDFFLDAGTREGPFLWNHDDGSPRARGSFDEDEKRGPWSFFDTDGTETVIDCSSAACPPVCFVDGECL